MTDERADDAQARFTVRTTAESHFAWLRTRLALERTMMAWVRTAVSLIGFGFAIVQFFDRLYQMPAAAPARFPDAPRFLGLALIACGVAALCVSIWEYRWTVRYLWNGLRPDRRHDPGRQAVADHGHCRRPDHRRDIRLLRRPAASRVEARGNTKEFDRVVGGERRDGQTKETEHPHPLGRRHRLVEHQLQQPRPDGLPDAEHRPHRPTKAWPSPTTTASKAAPPAAPRSSPARTRSAPA